MVRGICLIFGIIVGIFVAAMVFQFIQSITPEVIKQWGGVVFLVVGLGSILVMGLLVKWKEAKDHCAIQAMMKAEHDERTN